MHFNCDLLHFNECLSHRNCFKIESANSPKLLPEIFPQKSLQTSLTSGVIPVMHILNQEKLNFCEELLWSQLPLAIKLHAYFMFLHMKFP